MAKKRTRTRVSSKIDELPEELRVKVDVMLADTSNTYEYISQYLKQEGYEISKSSVGRYAMRSNTATQRLLEAQAQTEQLIRVVKDNPDADYTEAAIMLTMNGLVNKVATAEEEFQEMPLDKAGRLIASLSRTVVFDVFGFYRNGFSDGYGYFGLIDLDLGGGLSPTGLNRRQDRGGQESQDCKTGNELFFRFLHCYPPCILVIWGKRHFVPSGCGDVSLHQYGE